MALFGSSRVAATSQNELVFSWAAVQSVADNASTVSWSLQLTAGDYGRISATPGSRWAVTLDGHEFSGTTSIAIGNNETKTLASGNLLLEHDENGEKSFDFSFSQDFYIQFGGVSVRVVSGSGSGTLDPIVRFSRPTASASTVTLGTPVTIFTNPHGDYTHALEYSFGNASGVIAQGVGASVEWTPEPELARQIPDAPKGIAIIRCKTYLGDTLLGTGELALSLAVPMDMVPSLTAVFTDTSGAADRLGVPVQNVSRYAVEITGTGIYGSTVTAASVTLEGKPYAGEVLREPGSYHFSLSVTDSRGRVGTLERILVVKPYEKPALRLSASRCRADGTPDDTGEFAKITLSGAVAQVDGKNTGSLSLFYGMQVELMEVSGEFSRERIVAADSNATMDISATLTDRLLSVEDAMTLSTGYATLDFLAGGRGLALGKTATREGFDCAMPAYFTGGCNGLTVTALGEPVALTGPVLAALTRGSFWGLYLVAVSYGEISGSTRIAGGLEASFSLEEGLLKVEGASAGWLIGCV